MILYFFRFPVWVLRPLSVPQRNGLRCDRRLHTSQRLPESPLDRSRHGDSHVVVTTIVYCKTNNYFISWLLSLNQPLPVDLSDNNTCVMTSIGWVMNVLISNSVDIRSTITGPSKKSKISSVKTGKRTCLSTVFNYLLLVHLSSVSWEEVVWRQNKDMITLTYVLRYI